MTYTDASKVKDMAGSGNLPSTVTDAMIARWILRADSFVDSKTKKARGGWVASYTNSAVDGDEFDTDTPDLIEAASANMAAHYMYLRLASEEQMGTMSVTGPISEDMRTRQDSFRKMANQFKREAADIIKDLNKQNKSFSYYRTL